MTKNCMKCKFYEYGVYEYYDEDQEDYDGYWMHWCDKKNISLDDDDIDEACPAFKDSIKED